MLIFMIVYLIDNARHLFSIIWNVLFIISDMIPPIFNPGQDLSTFLCTCSNPLCLWHQHKLIKTSLVWQAQVSSFCFIIIFLHSFDFCFQFFVIFYFINILSAYLRNVPCPSFIHIIRTMLLLNL